MPKEKDVNICQVPFRLHQNDHKMLKKTLIDEGLKFQTFVDACVQAYLRADPAMLKVLKDYKELSQVPKDVKDRYTLSQRERQKIMDEIADAEAREKVF